MKRKIWTTRMMLDSIICSGIKSSWQIKENQSLRNEHAKIVALLKAFDLYVEEKQPIFNKHNDKIGEKYAFDISDFYKGNFIRKRSKKEVAVLMEELADEEVIFKPHHFRQTTDMYSFLCRVFNDLINHRINLQQIMDNPSYYRLKETIAIAYSLAITSHQIRIIDFVLLKIIGYKRPIPEKVLIKKYGFPETGLLTGDQSIADLLELSK